MKWEKVNKIDAYEIVTSLFADARMNANLINKETEESNIESVALRYKLINEKLTKYAIIIAIVMALFALVFRNIYLNILIGITTLLILYLILYREPKDYKLLNRFVLKNLLDKPIFLRNYSKRDIEINNKMYSLVFESKIKANNGQFELWAALPEDDQELEKIKAQYIKQEGNN